MKQVLKLGLEFWLPLPFLGLFFWIGSGFVTDRILSRPNQTESPLKVEIQSAKQQKTIILSITADIDKRQGVSRVKVKTASKALKELKFEFAVTDLSLLETAISQELSLPVEDVRNLMQYRIK